MVIKNNKNAYSPSSGITNVSSYLVEDHAPSSADTDYPLFQDWYDSTAQQFWRFVGNTASSGTLTANWLDIGGGSYSLESFVVSSGTSPVVPDGSNQITLTDGNGVGMTGGTNAITFDMVSPFTGDFTFTSSTAADTETLTVSNSDNTAASASGAQIDIAVGGTTQIGDPYVTFATGSSIAYSLGSDTSDSQVLKINTAASSTVTPSSGTELWLLNSSADAATGTLSIGHGGTPIIDVDFTLNGSAISAVLSIDTAGATDLGGIIDHRHSNTAGFGSHWIGLRSRGTHDTPTVVQSGDVLTRILSAGYDGTDYAQSVEIRAEVDGTPGANDMPGRWVFLVSPDGSQTPAEALRISQDKTIDIKALLTSTQASSGQWFAFNDGTDAFGYYNNAGSPESVVTASIGSWCSDTTNGEIYVKRTGDATNTGWSKLDSSATQSFLFADLSSPVTNVTGAGTQYSIICDNVVTDINGDYDNTTGIYTTPVDGIYLIIRDISVSSVSAAMTAGTTSAGIGNVTTLNPANCRDASNIFRVKVPVMKYLSASTSLQPTVTISNGGGDTAGLAYASFSVYLLG